MRILIIHHEAEYFAGAEKMLSYFLEGLAARQHPFLLAAVREGSFGKTIPEGLPCCWLPSNARFTSRQFLAQVRAIRQHTRERAVDLVHGWAARDWELTNAVALALRLPAVGTLHDHPNAPFISRARQLLMRACASLGLKRVVCVSEAVRAACADAGYPASRLRVVRNGLPLTAGEAAAARAPGPFRIGFLGQFSERKGLRGLFAMIDQLGGALNWELDLGGQPQGAEGERLVSDLQSRYSSATWWPRVHWRGWIKEPRRFLERIDMLVCPSSDFDPFPTVLLEAGNAGKPVLAAGVGGVSEIVEDGVTGWVFPAQDWTAGARLLRQVLETPPLAQRAGSQGKKRVEREFAIGRMVENYLKVYSELTET